MDTPVLVWVIASLAATLIAVIGTREAVQDVRALNLIVNGRRTVAYMHLRNQLGRLAIGVAWTLLGIPALLDDRVTPWSLGIAILVGSNVVLTVNAALDLRARRRLLA